MNVKEPTYMYIWEYLVHPDRLDEFHRAYASEGTWVSLFKRSHGHVRTELHRDRRNPHRFITIDYWKSAAAWESFRSQYSSEFKNLDSQCEALTTEEREIGRFDSVG